MGDVCDHSVGQEEAARPRVLGLTEKSRPLSYFPFVVPHEILAWGVGVGRGWGEGDESFLLSENDQ